MQVEECEARRNPESEVTRDYASCAGSADIPVSFQIQTY